MTTSGLTRITASCRARWLNTSRTMGCAPVRFRAGTLSASRVVPETKWPAPIKRGMSRRPTAPVAPARKTFTASPLRCALQPFHRLGDLGLARLRFLALFFFFLYHFFGRPGDEISVIQLGIDARDIGVGLSHFLGEACAFGGEIDHPLERQRCNLAAHDELDCTLGRGGGKGNVVAGGIFISPRTERMALTRSMTQPISASASALSRPSCAGHAASASM